MPFGSVLSNAKTVTLTTADDRTVNVKSSVSKFALRMIGIPHIGLRVRARGVLYLLNPQQNEIILDAGCGNGVYSFTLGFSGSIVYGVDNNKKTISNCQRMSEEMGLSNQIYFYKANLLKLPFDSNFFDKIVFSETLEHIQEDKKAIEELHRVLKPDGVMVISVPTNIFINKRYKKQFGHYRLYDITKLKKLLKKKFDIVLVARRNRLMGQLAWFLNRKFFFNKILVSLTFPFLYFMTYIDFYGHGRELLVKVRKK